MRSWAPVALTDHARRDIVRSCVAKETVGSVTTVHYDGNIIETIYKGYISISMVRQVHQDLERLLARYPGADWLIDTLESTGVAPAPHAERMAVFELFQAKGGRRIATVLKSSVIRMMSATFAFAFGLPMKSFETRSDALVYLRSKDS